MLLRDLFVTLFSGAVGLGVLAGVVAFVRHERNGLRADRLRAPPAPVASEHFRAAAGAPADDATLEPFGVSLRGGHLAYAPDPNRALSIAFLTAYFWTVLAVAMPWIPGTTIASTRVPLVVAIGLCALPPVALALLFATLRSMPVLEVDAAARRVVSRANPRAPRVVAFSAVGGVRCVARALPADSEGVHMCLELLDRSASPGVLVALDVSGLPPQVRERMTHMVAALLDVSVTRAVDAAAGVRVAVAREAGPPGATTDADATVPADAREDAPPLSRSAGS